MNNLFLTQFAQNIKSPYRCFDRVLIHGYIRKLFFEAGLVLFLRAMGFQKLSNGVLRLFTDQLNSHIKKEADQYSIHILWWPSIDGGKNGAKLAYVQKHFVSDHQPKGNFTYCIITDTETAMTFATKELTSKKGKTFRRAYKCKKLVKHYYIYFHDQFLGGPCYLKISSYLPLPCEFYFNGHNAIKQQLGKRIAYKMKDNAFTWVEDPETLQQIAQSITGRLVSERINYWMNRFFKFDKGTYSTRSKHLQHDWYMGQTEVCTNIIFKSARFCTNLFERLLDKFSRIGLPDSLSQIFGKRNTPTKTKSTARLYDNNACIKHWFRANSIKMYNKLGYFIRIETTINNPKSLGLKKPVLFLQAYLWYGVECNDRFANCCAHVDLTSIAENEPDQFSKPVLAPNCKKVPAVDSRKERQIELLKACPELDSGN